jgi:SAM-dependent methyltransferase
MNKALTHQRDRNLLICPVCGSSAIHIFIDITDMPVLCNVLWSSREEARSAPRGRIKLGFCADCGHIYNYAFDPDLMHYSQEYENSLHFSPHFQEYANGLARRLVETYNIRNKSVIDVGCGKGDFLTLICELGQNAGYGFDRSYTPERATHLRTDRVTFVQDFYSDKYSQYKADLVCCRHVLEHIQTPVEFVRGIRHSIGDRPDTVVFFEVPNVLYTLRDMGIWDLIYEHCSYFSAPSLARVFSQLGFRIAGINELYHGQFLGIDTIMGSNGLDEPQLESEVSSLRELVSAFSDRHRSKVEIWRGHLTRFSAGKQRVVVWGGGSKGVTFLNTFNAREQVPYMVDINPRKHGMFVAGTGQRIVPPEFLQEYKPDIVIIMNRVYDEEIRNTTNQLGLHPEFLFA